MSDLFTRLGKHFGQKRFGALSLKIGNNLFGHGFKVSSLAAGFRADLAAVAVIAHVRGQPQVTVFNDAVCGNRPERGSRRVRHRSRNECPRR